MAGTERIVDRIKRVGSAEDIPILVDAIRGLISHINDTDQLIRHIDHRLEILGEPTQLGQVWISPDLCQMFGVVPPSIPALRSEPPLSPLPKQFSRGDPRHARLHSLTFYGPALSMADQQ